VRQASQDAVQLVGKFELAQNRSQLTTALARVARELADHVAVRIEIVAGLIQRHPGPAAARHREHDPGKPDATGITRRHDLAGLTNAEAPVGQPRSVHDAFEFVRR